MDGHDIFYAGKGNIACLVDKALLSRSALISLACELAALQALISI